MNIRTCPVHDRTRYELCDACFAYFDQVIDAPPPCPRCPVEACEKKAAPGRILALACDILARAREAFHCDLFAFRLGELERRGDDIINVPQENDPEGARVFQDSFVRLLVPTLSDEAGRKTWLGQVQKKLASGRKDQAMELLRQYLEKWDTLPPADNKSITSLLDLSGRFDLARLAEEVLQEGHETTIHAFEASTALVTCAFMVRLCSSR